MQFHTDSRSAASAAHAVFGEALLNLVARELGDKALNSLAGRERLVAEMNIEVGRAAWELEAAPRFSPPG